MECVIQVSMGFNDLEVVMPCTVQKVVSELIVRIKVLQNMHWVKVLKEELLLVIIQMLKMAVAELKFVPQESGQMKSPKAQKMC